MSYTILINESKNELYNIKSNIKLLYKKLNSVYRIEINKDELSLDTLEGYDLLIFCGSTSELDINEIDALRTYLKTGHSVLVLMGDNGTLLPPINTNTNTANSNNFSNVPGIKNSMLCFNNWLSEYGITINDDSCIRTIYSKEYYHPKENMIINPILNNNLNDLILSKLNKKDDDNVSFNILYPYGCTLNVSKPSLPLLSSKELSLPASRPIGSFTKVGNGTLCVIGSSKIFSDAYLNKENNSVFLQSLILFLCSDAQHDVEDDIPENGEKIEVSDLETLSERLLSCLLDSEEIPSDFNTLFEDKMYGFDTNLVPDVLECFEKLNVKYDLLTLIPPTFELPQPSLNPAVFPPPMRDLPPPPLELFDIDQEFADENAKLAQLVNKCDPKDIEYYIRESGEVLGIEEKIIESGSAVNKRKGTGRLDTKQILFHMLQSIVNYKKQNQ